MKHIKFIALPYFLLVFLFGNCTGNAVLVIEPISRESNESFLTGKGLDTNYFSTKDVVQYYQVSGYKNGSSAQLLLKLQAFVMEHYHVKNMKDIQQLEILFYRKKMLSNYSDIVYESARENEMRTLTDHNDDLVASIDFERLTNDPKVVIRRAIIYHTGYNKPLIRTDTIAP